MKKHFPLISLILNVLAGFLFMTDGVLDYFETGELQLSRFGLGTMFILIGIAIWKKKNKNPNNNTN